MVSLRRLQNLLMVAFSECMAIKKAGTGVPAFYG